MMAIGRQEELADEIPRFADGQPARLKIVAIKVDKPRIGPAQRILTHAVEISDRLANKPKRVQALEERARRLPRAARRRFGDALQPFVLRGARRARNVSGAPSRRQPPPGLLRELELDLTHRVEADERGLELLAAVGIVLRTLRERRRDVGPDAPEALLQDLPDRRDVMAVVGERSAAEREALRLAAALQLEGAVGDEVLLLVEAAADAVDVTARHDLAALAPAAVHARLEVERTLLEEERHEVLANREVALAPDVERVEPGMRRRPCVKVCPDGLRARQLARILARAVAFVGIERPQLGPKRRVVRRLERIRPLGSRRPNGNQSDRQYRQVLHRTFLSSDPFAALYYSILQNISQYYDCLEQSSQG